MPRQERLSRCPTCSGSIRFVERTADRTPNDHHNNVYYCPDCEKEIVSG